MRSPISALIWETWRQKRALAATAVLLVALGWIFNLVIPESFRVDPADHGRCTVVSFLLATATIGLVFGIFNHTESSPQRDWTGFPYRLFTLPVPSLALVLTPMLLGVASVELAYLAALKLIFMRENVIRPEWLAVLLGSYMVFYQTILWSLAGFRVLRMIVLGSVGVSFIGVAFLPLFSRYVQSPWFSEKLLSAALGALAVTSFFVAWASVARQRHGGGRRRSLWSAISERVTDALPGRTKAFHSPQAAHFWFEWRRAGWILPGCVAAAVVLVIAPLSWSLRKDAALTLWLLGWLLALPVLLAIPVGKGFSLPDFWSQDLSIPAFVAVKPISSDDMVAVRLRVAALSSLVAWSLVVLFLTLWLSSWANLEQLGMVRIPYWMIYDHTVSPQYAIAALFVVSGVFLTWKFLAGGLWIGLSGRKKWFIGSTAAYAAALLAAAVSLVVLLRHDDAFRHWVHRDPDRLVAIFQWAAALAVVAKVWLAAWAWRGASPRRTRQYMLFWVLGTGSVFALMQLLWAHGAFSLALMEFMRFPPLDHHRLKGLMILVALLVVPLARPGLAPAFLARNRHNTPSLPGARASFNLPFAIVAVMLTAIAFCLATDHMRFGRVNIGGPDLRVWITGHGKPTVVFESGAGATLETWVTIQPEVAKFAQTFSYDRAGNGRSDKGTEPRDGIHVANELHTALRNAGMPPPYVMVGHSLGGPYIRIFAGLYSNEVAGMVLVDPTQEEVIAWAEDHGHRKPHEHKLRPSDEVDCAPSTFAQASQHPVPSQIPISLISGQGPKLIPGFIDEKMRQEVLLDQKTLYPAKLRFHRAWVEKFPRGRLIITENSGHGIPFEEPDLVIRTIHEMTLLPSSKTEQHPNGPIRKE